MSSTTHDAASFVRERLRGHASRISQDEMKTLIDDLKAMMGRALTASDVAKVVEVIAEISGAQPA